MSPKENAFRGSAGGGKPNLKTTTERKGFPGSKKKEVLDSGEQNALDKGGDNFAAKRASARTKSCRRSSGVRHLGEVVLHGKRMALKKTAGRRQERARRGQDLGERNDGRRHEKGSGRRQRRLKTAEGSPSGSGMCEEARRCFHMKREQNSAGGPKSSRM